MTLSVGIAGRLTPPQWDRLHTITGVEFVDLANWGGASRPADPVDGTGRDASQDTINRLDAIYCLGTVHRELSEAPGLKWLQCSWAGIDWAHGSSVFQRGVIVTNGKGFAATSVAEWGLTAILSLAKYFHLYARHQARHEWTRHRMVELSGKTAGIVGLGAIGTELARMVQALGMRVVAIRRSGPGTPPPFVEWLRGTDSLDDLLAESDFVVLAAPRTPETKKMIGSAQLHRMKSSAYLVNLARGALVDEAALIDALQNNVIAGAALDVFEREPLPADSPLWDLDNVLLTPHVSGLTPAAADRGFETFYTNLKAFAEGRIADMQNVVDPEKGY